ncbi:MAG: pyridoxal 5'-phosphate synthase glutaminase subunit PdxT [Myxococcota bacterium]|jgi:5'-phosphate synthase pdxT subunit|nr:pyridoxal 5'-phosphate synthase glutaminase subunit PdxT [Myxococcota bacterium]
MRIGVLALQGAFEAHAKVLRALGHDTVELRNPGQLDGLEGVVLPGGESSTQLKLLESTGLERPLDAFVRAGHPLLATCAGLILAARHVTQPVQSSFGWLDVSVARNAWGAQVYSFEAVADENRPPFAALPLIFIRAPRIIEVGKGVEVLARFRGEPVMLRQGRVLAASFHPELSGDDRVHRAVFGP